MTQTAPAPADLFGTPNLGTGPLEHRERIDFPGLRRARLDRFLRAMDEHDLDVCFFGREANARYVTGVRRLWTAQSRPFVPAAFVSATRSGASRTQHLMPAHQAGCRAHRPGRAWCPRRGRGQGTASRRGWLSGHLLDKGAQRAFLTGGILVKCPMLYHEPKTYAVARSSRKGQVRGTIQERRQRPWAAGLSG